MLKEGTFIKKKFMKVLISLILGWFVTIFGDLANSIIAGLYLDSDAVSAVGLISPIESVIYFLSLLICVGCALMYSNALGANEMERSQKLAGMGVVVSVAIGMIMAALMLIGKDAILNFYECTGQIYTYASEYYNPLVILALIEPLLWTLYNLVSYDGDGRQTLLIDIVMGVSHVGISLLLVKSNGAAGLSIGTMLSYLLGIIFAVPHFLKKTNSIHFKLHFNLKELLEMARLSSSTALTTLYTAIVMVVLNKLVIDRFGEKVLPACTVISAMLELAAFLSVSIIAGTMFVAVAYSEENNFAVRRAMRLVNRSMLIIAALYTVLMIVVSNFWPVLYDIQDPVVARAAVYAGQVISATFILTAIVYNYISYYPAVEKSREANILSIAYMLIGPLVLAIPLGFSLGFKALVIGFALSPAFALAVLFVYCLIKGTAKKLPYLLPDDKEINFHYDLKLEKESILELRNIAGAWLTARHVRKKTVNDIQIIIEETLLHIKNRNKKTIYCECDLLMGDDHIRLITKDNGVIFDMLQDAEDAFDLRCYIASRMMTHTVEKSYTVATSFNRNMYRWEKQP